MALMIPLVFAATFLVAAASLIAWRARLSSGCEAPGDGLAAESSGSPSLLRDDALSTISVWQWMLARFDFVKIMRVNLAQAGLSWTVGRLTALMLLCGAVALAILLRLGWTSGLGSLAAAAFAGHIPYVYVLRIRNKRLAKFEGQFPDALDSLARSLRAGHPLAAGLQLLGYEAPEPLAGEMRRTLNERNLGTSWDQALDNLAERVPQVEVSVFAAAVQLQNRTGGKLNEVLGRLAETMRESYALKGEIRAIAAHGRLTGGLLTVLPIGIAAAMTMVNPAYLSLLWKHPSGKDLIAAALACLVAAHYVIRRLVDIRI